MPLQAWQTRWEFPRVLGADQVEGPGGQQPVWATIPTQWLHFVGGAREPEAQSPDPNVQRSWTPVGFRAASGGYPDDNQHRAAAPGAAHEADGIIWTPWPDPMESGWVVIRRGVSSAVF